MPLDEGDFQMEELPEIPVNPVEEDSVFENDLLLVKRLLSVCISFLLVIMSIWIIWVIANEDLQNSGPHPLLVEIHSDYDSLVQISGIPLYTGSGVRVCIVDSGIDLDHPEFADFKLQGWKDFINDKPTPYDDHGHGTMMAGILVGQTYLKGVAPDVDLLVAKALSKGGNGSDELVGEAIDWCVNSGSDIISLSLGGAPGVLPSQFGGDSSSAAANNAISQGVIVVAAAGNDGQNSSDNDVSSPGGERDVICVGGVDVNGNLWGGSSIGDNNGRIWPSPLLPRNDPNKKPEVVAPAEDVPVIMQGGGWGLANGTSAATVYVTGSMALLLDAREDLRHNGSAGGDDSTVQQIKQWLMESVKAKSGQSGHDDHYGYGMLQARALLEAAGAPLD
jgi:serine protease AprX